MGIEPTTYGLKVCSEEPTTAETASLYDSPAKSLPRSLPQKLRKDDELQRIIDAWPTLPKDVRKMIAGVVAMTRRQ